MRKSERKCKGRDGSKRKAERVETGGGGGGGGGRREGGRREGEGTCE